MLSIEQKYEYLFTEMQRLKVENKELKERDKLQTKTKNELQQALNNVEEQNAKLKKKKAAYKEELMEVFFYYLIFNYLV